MAKNNNHKKIAILSVFVALYMCTALAWWAILLNKKNIDNYIFQNELVLNNKDSELSLQTQLSNIQAHFEKQRKMILGEGLVFALALIIGIWLIYRAFAQQIGLNNRQKNFILSVSHEFKSPLASIRLILETLSTRVLDSNKIQEFSNNALVETERLENLINNLLFSARIEADYSFNFESVELKPIIINVLNHLRDVFPHFNIKLQCADHIRLFCDKESIFIVIKNLIENAMKYSQKLKSIEVIVESNKKETSIVIADQGIGVPDEEKIQIFEKFYRVGSEETRIAKGTGLGLYLCKNIIEAHGGKISVSNNIPSGSKFLIRIPKRKVNENSIS